MLQSGQGMRDGWTDGWTEWNQYTPPNNFVVWGVWLLIVLRMSANEFTEVPPHHCMWNFTRHSVRVKGDYNRMEPLAINKPLKFVYFGRVGFSSTLIGSHLTREPTASPVLTKWWSQELMWATNFGSLSPNVTNFGNQNFGYQIWFCTRLIHK